MIKQLWFWVKRYPKFRAQVRYVQTTNPDMSMIQHRNLEFRAPNRASAMTDVALGPFEELVYVDEIR